MSFDGGGGGGAGYCDDVSVGDEAGGGICVGVFPCVSHHAGKADHRTSDLIWADLCPLHHNCSVLGIGIQYQSLAERSGEPLFMPDRAQLLTDILIPSARTTEGAISVRADQT